jgi:hypothetical protein
VAPPPAGEPLAERVRLPDEHWWDNPGPAIVAGIVGLIAGGLLGYAIGNSASNAKTVTTGAGPAITHTVTQTQTVTQPKLVEHSSTVTTTTPAPANSATEERRIEAESDLRKSERENEQLKRQLEES